ncbi:MAG TPA: ATP-binding protein [Bryobacteraceae bacterium]|nr:ATP-binding protein [Bryobacteraceae bacterium]
MIARSIRFAAALAAVGAILTIDSQLRVNATTAALTLLLAILGISAQLGLTEALAASVAAMFGFNILFLPPIGKLTIQDPQNWVALAAFLVTAVTASQLSAHARRRAAEAEARRVEIEQLYSLVQSMLLTGSARKTIREFVNRAIQVFGCTAAAFYYRPTDEFVRSGPESQVVTDHELLVESEVENPSVDLLRGVALAPVRLGGRPLGSMALIGPPPPDKMVRAISNLMAITIEKARALEDAGHAEAARQSEALKSALLDSLAHDLKTPLTSIKAAVTSLLGGAPGADKELLTIINEEADRLNRIAAEVVEMARIEAGKLHLEKQPVAVPELIAGALSELSVPLRGRPFTVRVAGDLPNAIADRDFAAQVVRQFVENALKYSPEGSPVEVSAEAKGGKIVIGVGDRGPGIEENERTRIFDKFYRGRRHRFDTEGTGMGLAIAKGIVEAHGEKIWVVSEPGQGAVFYFSLAASAGGREG